MDTLDNQSNGNAFGSDAPYIAGVVALSAVFFAYAVLRARMLSITHDEALTYLLHVFNTSYTEIFLHLKPIGSNNHLLNSLGMKLLADRLGNAELVLRIPALLGYALYLAAGFSILRLFLDRHNLFIGLVLLQTNPFLMDFFSLARGYSLGVGLSLWGVYYLFKRVQVTDPADTAKIVKTNLLSLAMLSLSVTANLTFLTMYAAVAVVLLIVELAAALRSRRRSATGSLTRFSLSFLLPLFVSGVVLGIVYQPAVIEQIMPHLTDWGGVRGFWHDTVRSLVKASFYGQPHTGRRMVDDVKLAIIGVFLVALATGLTLLVRRKKTRSASRYLIAVTGLLLIIGVSASVQHYLIGQRYALERGAIFLIPLFLLLLLLLWRHVWFIGQRSLRVAVQIFCVGVFLVFSIHGVSCVNLTYCYDWKYDAFTKKAAARISAMAAANREQKKKARVGINWVFQPSMDFYIVTRKMTSVRRTHRKGPDGVFDYYYILDTDRHVVDKYGLRVVEQYPLAKSLLAVPE
jgi:hypothetical protein